jgi:hypothetical protein
MVAYELACFQVMVDMIMPHLRSERLDLDILPPGGHQYLPRGWNRGIANDP